MRTDPRKACANQEENLLWALIHDGIAHPLMALTLFSGWAVVFHDWTSKKAWPRKAAVMVSKQIWYHKEDKEDAFSFAEYLRVNKVAHCVSSIPQGDGTFHYTVEVLA